jgi:hypothetical protein
VTGRRAIRRRRVEAANPRRVDRQLPQGGIAAGEGAGEVLGEDVSEVLGAGIGRGEEIGARAVQVDCAPAADEQEHAEHEPRDCQLSVELHPSFAPV